MEFGRATETLLCDDDYILADQFGDPDDGSAAATDAGIACAVANRVDAATHTNVVTAGMNRMEWPLEVLRVKMATIETMSLVNLHVLHHRNDCDGNDIHC